MCSATERATPVNVFTCAASAIFSCGVRGTPACGNTLNRVPELPNAQDGSSMRCSRRAVMTRSRSTIMPLLHDLVLEVEDLLQDKESLVRRAPVEAGEEGRHLRLPPRVHLR